MHSISQPPFLPLVSSFLWLNLTCYVFLSLHAMLIWYIGSLDCRMYSSVCLSSSPRSNANLIFVIIAICRIDFNTKSPCCCDIAGAEVRIRIFQTSRACLGARILTKMNQCKYALGYVSNSMWFRSTRSCAPDERCIRRKYRTGQ